MISLWKLDVRAGRPLLAALMLLGLTARARNAAAQVTVEAGPLIGYYSPTPSSAEDGPNAPGNFFTRASGAEALMWIGPRFGVRADFIIASKTRNEIPNPGGWEPGFSARITTASALVTYDVSEKHSRALWLGAGPGYIRHAGQAFGDSGNPTSIAAVFGLGSTIPLGSAIRVELGASAFLYEYGGMFGLVGGPPSLNATGQFERRFQHDGVLHVGVAWNGR